MDLSEQKRRWYCPTPGWLVYGSLAATGLLFLSEHWRWFPFNEKKGWTVLLAVAAVGAVLGVMLLWWLVALAFRWRFQVGISTLLVLTVAVALPCSWLAVEMKAAREQRQAAAAIEEMGGTVDWSAPSGPNWLGSCFGAAFDRSVLTVNLFCTQVTDDDLEQVGSLTQLDSLDLSLTKVTDMGVQHLKGLEQLHVLSLINTQVTDSGVVHLKGLRQLRELILIDNQVTDAGLEHLKNLNQLQELYLGETQVTDAGVKKLQQALPNCKIER